MMKVSFMLFLLACILTSLRLEAQCNSGYPIPNRSFEHWASVGGAYEEPVGWTTNNTPQAIVVLKDSINKVDSNYSMRVEAGGIAISSKFRLYYNWFVPTIKCTWAGTDSITIWLIHYHLGVPVDSVRGMYYTPGFANWHDDFVRPQMLYNDSAVVKILGGHNAGTAINVDCLKQYAEGIDDIIASHRAVISPNPANAIASLHFSNPAHVSYNFVVADVRGNIVFEQKGYSGEEIEFSCRGLAGGTYFWQLYNATAGGRVVGKLIVE